ncbi:MAG: AAA family ATPase, partial [Pseudomonas sp.]|uniref:AAA family ATPase n=1 Tax=Pseudomonas sp. TaxID=306 RepID=UPI0030F01AFB
MELGNLISRLNNDCRRALERAAQRCLQRTHHYVEIEHLLLELLDIEGGDFAYLLPRFGLERDALSAEINKALELFKAGSTRTPALSTQTIGLLEDAVVQASVLGLGSIRSGLLLVALLDRDERRTLLLNSASSLLRIPRDALRSNLLEWTQPSKESPPAARTGQSPKRDQAPDEEPLLNQYTQDLTEDARNGRIDPIVGRDGEIRQTIDILLRRRQNNPILVGAPGVGKTAVVEGLALRIAAGDVPPPLKDVSVRVLDLGLLQAGAGVKGEFEQRLKGVIDAVRSAEKPIILFIDEAHTMIGAGAAEGSSDAANLLKPALARGELRTIAATTWMEYKKYFEKDPALARRFQLVQVEEPDEATAVEMLRGVASKLEQHHGVQVLDAAIHDAVKLSHRYISGRQLPDKAISVLDTACARVSLGQHDVPPPLESLRHRQVALHEELDRLRREQATGLKHSERITGLEDEAGANVLAIRELEKRWSEEREAVSELLQTRRELLTLSDSLDPNSPDEELDGRIDHLAAELARLESGLDAIRQDDPLVPEQVDSKIVAAVIAGWTGIPVGKMLADEAHAVRTLG